MSSAAKVKARAQYLAHKENFRARLVEFLTSSRGERSMKASYASAVAKEIAKDYKIHRESLMTQGSFDVDAAIQKAELNLKRNSRGVSGQTVRNQTPNMSCSSMSDRDNHKASTNSLSEHNLPEELLRKKDMWNAIAKFNAEANREEERKKARRKEEQRSKLVAELDRQVQFKKSSIAKQSASEERYISEMKKDIEEWKKLNKNKEHTRKDTALKQKRAQEHQLMEKEAARAKLKAIEDARSEKIKKAQQKKWALQEAKARAKQIKLRDDMQKTLIENEKTLRRKLEAKEEEKRRDRKLQIEYEQHLAKEDKRREEMKQQRMDRIQLIMERMAANTASPENTVVDKRRMRTLEPDAVLADPLAPTKYQLKKEHEAKVRAAEAEKRLNEIQKVLHQQVIEKREREEREKRDRGKEARRLNARARMEIQKEKEKQKRRKQAAIAHQRDLRKQIESNQKRRNKKDQVAREALLNRDLLMKIKQKHGAAAEIIKDISVPESEVPGPPPRQSKPIEPSPRVSQHLT